MRALIAALLLCFSAVAIAPPAQAVGMQGVLMAGANQAIGLCTHVMCSTATAAANCPYGSYFGTQPYALTASPACGSMSPAFVGGTFNNDTPDRNGFFFAGLSTDASLLELVICSHGTRPASTYFTTLVVTGVGTFTSLSASATGVYGTGVAASCTYWHWAATALTLTSHAVTYD